MTDDPNERWASLGETARLEARIRELESSIRGCKTDIYLLAAGLVVVFLLGLYEVAGTSSGY